MWAEGGLSHLGDLMFCQKKLCMRCDARTGTLSWWSCQSLVVHSCSLLNHLNSFWRGGGVCSSLMQNLMQIYCSIHSVILNAMARKDTCSLNNVYHPHWLVRWSHLSSPLSLAATLLRYCANCSHYLNNGSTFSGQTSWLIQKVACC